MVTSNSKPNQFLLATFITFFLLLLNKVNSYSDLSFKFDKFLPNQKDIVFQGAATVSSTGVLQLTKVGKPAARSVGRALYAVPVPIWDSTTGNVTSFRTSFSFVVKATDASKTADGLTFFLAPVNSQIPAGTAAGFFGHFKDQSSRSSNQIVAIEFDTYFDKAYNPWDPAFKHIGIDVNSIKSQKTVKWDWRNGQTANVVITYQAPTKSLSVSLSYPSAQKSNTITATVDLKAILPEWVSVGFSAGVGDPKTFETHDILSWYFTTNLKDNNNDAALENIVHVTRDTA